MAGLRLGTLSIMLLLALPAWADERLYHIELILFRHANPVVASQPVPYEWQQGAELLPVKDDVPAGLNGILKTLQSRADYRVILHRSWNESLDTSQRASLALVQGPQRFEYYPVQGRLDLRPGQPVRAEINFWVNRFAADGLLSSSEHIEQSLDLRPGRLHYLDHASLGLLIQITPQ